MPKNVLEYRCLLISPGDVQQERDALTDLVIKWNAQIGQALVARVELIRWESHATPDMSGPAQDIINSKLLGECDFAIAVFWSRLGTPTAQYESGSVEEIYRLLEQGSRVLVYFSTQPIPQDAINNEQFIKLQAIKKRLEQQGLLGQYHDIPNLREQVQLHITSVVAELISKDRLDISQLLAKPSSTVPKPDVRIKTNIRLVPDLSGEFQKILSIKVENHSALPFFMGNVELKIKDARLFYVKRDSVTGEFQHRRKLESGESFAFNITPEVIAKQVSPKDLVCAIVTDDINRLYESDEAEFRLAMQVLFDEGA